MQATCKLKQVTVRLQTAPQKLVQGVLGWVEKIVGKLSYLARMKHAYGLEPLLYTPCRAELWLWYVWHPDYGVIYDELAQLRSGKYDLPPDIRLSEDKDESAPTVQPLLFEWPIAFVYV